MTTKAHRTPAFLLLAILTSSILLRAGPATSQGRPVALEDLGTRISLNSPVISPDGTRVVIVTSRANYTENRFDHSLSLVDVFTGATRVLAKASFSVGSPKWSPRGDRIAWLETGGDGQPQIYVMSVIDHDAAPRKITNVIDGVRSNSVIGQSYEWSPDGDSIAFITADPKEQHEGDERNNKSFVVVDNDYLAKEAPRSFHLWVVSAAGGQPRQLTSGKESVTGLGWLRDGQSIAFISQPRPHNSPLDFAEFMNASSRSTALKTVDVMSGTQRVIVPTPASIESAPVASPRSDLIAYRRFQGPAPWTRPHNVTVVALTGGEPRDVTAKLDRDIREFAWQPRSRGLLVAAPDGTRMALWSQAVDGPARRLDLGPVINLEGLTVSETGVLAFVGTEAQRAPELYVMASPDSKPRRLTALNAQIDALMLGRPATIRWRLDGFDETGVLIYPVGYKQGKRFPLVLVIHGGPEDTSTAAFDLFDQILAGRGWAVLNPNYRGSDSQGDAFQRAVINDLGDGPGRDVMAGLAAVKANGFVDESRVAVSGGSYGGFMTAWLIGHYQGWSAAVARAPLTNLLDWYNLSCCNAWADPALGGSPWLHGNFANYWRQSPISYANEVRTPTLILQNTGDPEVPYTGTYSFYHALRDNGVPVQFVIYPIDGHGSNGDPIHQRDVLRRWIGWIDEHFRAPAKEPH